MAEEEMSKQLQDQINRLQQMSMQLQMIMQQRQQVELRLKEIDEALEELNKQNTPTDASGSAETNIENNEPNNE